MDVPPPDNASSMIGAETEEDEKIIEEERWKSVWESEKSDMKKSEEKWMSTKEERKSEISKW